MLYVHNSTNIWQVWSFLRIPTHYTFKMAPMLTHAEQMTFFNFQPCSSESLCTPLENKLLSDKNLHLHISLLCSCMLQIGCQRHKKQNSNTCQYDWKWDCFFWCVAPALSPKSDPWSWSWRLHINITLESWIDFSREKEFAICLNDQFHTQHNPWNCSERFSDEKVLDDIALKANNPLLFKALFKWLHTLNIVSQCWENS